MRKAAVILFVFSMMFLLTACGSIEKETEKAELNAKEAFGQKPESPNQTVEPLRFHLPAEMKIKEKSPNNIILEKGTHPYILFYNQNEALDSEALYQPMAEDKESMILNKTFKDEKRFGYIVIYETGNGLYEVTAGIGGIKVTTESAKKNVADDAQLMMEIVNSSSFAEKKQEK